MPPRLPMVSLTRSERVRSQSIPFDYNLGCAVVVVIVVAIFFYLVILSVRGHGELFMGFLFFFIFFGFSAVFVIDLV